MPRLYYCLIPLLFGYVYQSYKYLSDILKGGIGKNGSTVAVSVYLLFLNRLHLTPKYFSKFCLLSDLNLAVW